MMTWFFPKFFTTVTNVTQALVMLLVTYDTVWSVYLQFMCQYLLVSVSLLNYCHNLVTLAIDAFGEKARCLWLVNDVAHVCSKCVSHAPWLARKFTMAASCCAFGCVNHYGKTKVLVLLLPDLPWSLKKEMDSVMWDQQEEKDQFCKAKSCQLSL